MSSVTIPGEQRVLLRSVDWQTYEALADNPDRAGRLITFDRGLLEIMSPSKSHESDKSMLGRMVEMFTLMRGIDIASSASTTFKRRDLQRAFEADESYYIQHEPEVRAKREIDLTVDPPPDLVIEIEMSRSAMNKLALLAAIGVPEIWRYDGRTLWIGRHCGESYEAIRESVVLAGFPVADAVRILQERGTESETARIRRFVESVRT